MERQIVQEITKSIFKIFGFLVIFLGPLFSVGMAFPQIFRSWQDSLELGVLFCRDEFKNWSDYF